MALCLMWTLDLVGFGVCLHDVLVRGPSMAILFGNEVRHFFHSS